jgi:hypothetical protein
LGGVMVSTFTENFFGVDAMFGSSRGCFEINLKNKNLSNSINDFLLNIAHTAIIIASDCGV